MIKIGKLDGNAAFAEGIFASPIVSKGRDLWMTTGESVFLVRVGDVVVQAIIDAGFIFDIDSVPRGSGLFYAWFKGRTRVAPMLHDYMYNHGAGKDISDKAFLRVMELEGVRYRYRKPIYWAVRFFGKGKNGGL
jgi:hypothetical protein